MFDSYADCRRWHKAIKVAQGGGVNTREIDRYTEFLQAVAPTSVPVDPSDTEVWFSESAWRSATAKLPAAVDRKFVVAVPSSSWVGKNWPVEKWASFLQQYVLRYPDMTVILLGGQSDMAVCSDIVARTAAVHNPIVNMCGLLTLNELVALVAHSQIYIGADTGTLHIAVACKVLTICILGGGHFRRFFPYGDEVRNIAIQNQMDCFGCAWKCKFATVRCIREISVESVLCAAIQQTNRLKLS